MNTRPQTKSSNELMKMPAKSDTSDFRKIILTSTPNHRRNARIPSQPEGRLAIVTKRGTGCGGRGSADNERRGCGRRNRVVLMPRRWHHVLEKLTLLGSNGGKKARSPGRARISRKTIAQGRPDCLRFTCMLVCAFPVHQCTRDRGCSAHPVFPAPFVFKGPTNL